MFFTIIEYNSKEYQQMVDLRLQILRIPLGLVFKKEDLALDKEDILMGCFDDSCSELRACCILTKIDKNIIKLRQMAVGEEWQGKGVGRELILFAEKFAKKEGFKKIIMNARDIATGFYKKLGYNIIGSEFVEVSIPHYKMEKFI